MKTLFTLPLLLLMLCFSTESHAKNEFFWALICPNDTTISCNVDVWDLSKFGNAYYHDANGYHSAGNPTVYRHLNSCGAGYITRTWSIEDPYWNIQKCTQTITIGSSVATFKESNIHWPAKEVVLTGCNPNTDPSVTGEPSYDILGCNMIAVGKTDNLYIVNENCKKIIRIWKVMDWCQANQGGGWAYDGIWTFEQHIKIMNSDIPAVVCPKDTVVNTMDCNYGDVTLGDLKVDPSSCGGQYTITNNSPYSTNKGANASGRYPVGTTKVTYSILYGCGSKKYCDFNITVKGGKAPTPICVSELAIGLMGIDANLDGINDRGMVRIWAKDLNLKSTPNCGYGPLTFSFSPDSVVMFKEYTCNDLGINLEKMYVSDKGGGQAYCLVKVDVQNNGARIENCVRQTTVENSNVNSGVKYSIYGKVKDVFGNAVENIDLNLFNAAVTYRLVETIDTVVSMEMDSFVNQTGALIYTFETDTVFNSTFDSVPVPTDFHNKKSLANGKFSFDKALESGKSYIFEPTVPANFGTINTFDLKLIAEIAFGNTIPANPYIKMAADIDGNGVVDNNDVQAMLDYFGSKGSADVGSLSYVFKTEKGTYTGENFLLETIVKSLANVELVLLKKGDVSNVADATSGFKQNLGEITTYVRNGMKQVTVYPNPFSDQFYLDLETEKDQMSSFKLFDQTGRLVKSQTMSVLKGRQTLPIDASELQNGIYIYQITVDNAVSTGKIIRQF